MDSLDEKLTYKDLYEAALENSWDPGTTMQELRVLEHLKAMASTKFITRLIEKFEAGKKAGQNQ